MKLAHSAPSAEREPQGYGEHAANVRAAGSGFSKDVSRFSNPESGWSDWLRPISVATEWHDLGKLDEKNQIALEMGRAARLPVDHVDAGVAYALRQGDEAAAWLIRSHHAPGLPQADREKVRGTFSLRGSRHVDDDDFAHAPLVDRNNAQLDSLIEIHREAFGKASVEGNPSTPKHGLSARIALSCLVDADHSDTARFDEFGAGNVGESSTIDLRWEERLESLRSFVANKKSTSYVGRKRLSFRQQLFEHCSAELHELNPLSTCEAPVGLGKTTAVLAYLLRHAISRGLRRIIVIAPYTNILTQTAQTIREALALEGEDPNAVVLEHHHRAEFEDISLRGLSANWDAPIVLTTAVQFFETLAANQPSALRKLHRVPGSALFIDESHAALPIHLWPQCFEWIRELSADWSCPTVLASGSSVRFWAHSWGRPSGKPALHLEDITPPSITSLAAEQEHLRVELREISKPAASSILVSEVCHRLEKGYTVLLIVNTVLSAAGLASLLSKRLGENDLPIERLSTRRVLHISTGLTPAHRERVLEEIQKRMEQVALNPWVLIATSCVEAGVDLDFHDGFREDASLMSFIQTGGRINRHENRDSGTLTRFQISSDSYLSPHPQLAGSAQIFRNLFSELRGGAHSLSDLSTVAAAREVKNRSDGEPGHLLCEAESKFDYPEVAKICRVISSETITVIVDPALAGAIRGGHRPPVREILRGSVQLWDAQASKLGLEPLNTRNGSTEIWVAKDGSYDHGLLGIGKAILAEKLSRESFLLVEER